MSLSPLDVVKNVQDVPTMLQHRFSNMLVNLISVISSYAQRNLAKQRQQEDAGTVTATKKFKTPQKLPSAFIPDRDHKFPEIPTNNDEPRNKYRGP